MKKDELRRLRRRLRMTQVELADMVGVASNTVARWERGEVNMPGTTERLVRMLIDAKLKANGRKRRK